MIFVVMIDYLITVSDNNINNSNIDSIHKCQTNTMQNSVLGNKANSDYLAYKMNVSWTAFQMRLGMQQLSSVFL